MLQSEKWAIYAIGLLFRIVRKARISATNPPKILRFNPEVCQEEIFVNSAMVTMIE